MRNRGNITDRSHSNLRTLDGSNRSFSPGPGSFNQNVDFLQPDRFRIFYDLIGCKASRVRRTLARSLETGGTGTGPYHNVSFLVSNRDNCIVECRVDIYFSVRHRPLCFSRACPLRLLSFSSHAILPILSLILSLNMKRLSSRSSPLGEGIPYSIDRSAFLCLSDYFFFAPRRRPRPATVFFGPLRVRAFVRVRWPRTGKERRCRRPR